MSWRSTVIAAVTLKSIILTVALHKGEDRILLLRRWQSLEGQQSPVKADNLKNKTEYIARREKEEKKKSVFDIFLLQTFITISPNLLYLNLFWENIPILFSHNGK